MSRATQMEQGNDEQFHQLASKISAFKSIASDINAYSQEDQSTLSGLNNQMNALAQGIKDSANQLTRVMKANPKVTRMVAIGFVIFLVVYYSVKLL